MNRPSVVVAIGPIGMVAWLYGADDGPQRVKGVHTAPFMQKVVPSTVLSALASACEYPVAEGAPWNSPRP